MRKNLIIYAAIVIVVGAGIAIVASGRVPFTDTIFTVPFLEKSPDKVIAATMENMAALDSVKTEMLANIIVESVSETTTTVTEPVNTKITYRASTDLTNNNMDGSASISFGYSGFDVDLGLDIKTVDEVTYLRIPSIPSIPGLDEFIDLSQFQNVWFRFDSTEVIDGLDDVISTGDLFGLLFGLGEGVENVNSMMPSEEEAEELSKQVQALVYGSDILVVDKRLPDEEINGIKTYHYTYHIDKDELKSLMVELMDLTNNSMTSDVNEDSFLELIPSEVDLEETVDMALQDLGEISGEIWVGKKDMYTYQLTMALALDYAEVYSGRVSVAVKSSEFNQPVSVEAPADSENIVEYIMSMFDINSMMPTDPDDDYTDYITDTDEDDLADYWEELFGTDPDDSDTDGDGYLDGEEVENGYNPNGEGEMSEADLQRKTSIDQIFSVETETETETESDSELVARDETRQADLRLLQSAIELYKNENGVVPLNDSTPTWEVFLAEIDGYYSSSDVIFPPGGAECQIVDGEIQGNCYVYCENGEDYLLAAELETNQDIARDLDGPEVSYDEATDCITSDGGSFETTPNISCDDPVYCIGDL